MGAFIIPGFEPSSNQHKYIRFGFDDNNKYAGFMYNNNNPAFGDGDDFTIFTYNSRDIVLKAGGSSGNIILLPKNLGKVGIGVSSNDDMPGNHKLYVNGNIRANKVIVEDIGADHVFYDDYNLMNLYDLKGFIDKNKHLPGIPPANETRKEVELSNFSQLLLQKVEELTLYTIDQNKQIEQLEKQVEQLENEKETLKKQNNQIDALIKRMDAIENKTDNNN